MLTQLPLKKNYLLVAATAMLLLFCYQLAFKKTLEAWQFNKQLERKVAGASDVSYQPAYMQRKNNNLTTIIRRYKTDTAAFRNNWINTISSIADKEHVKLSEVPTQSISYHTDQFIIQKLTFDGDFFSLIKILNKLQALNGIGIIRSADFKASEIRAGNNQGKKLMLEVYLETTSF